jgi:hypothetical protein
LAGKAFIGVLRAAGIWTAAADRNGVNLKKEKARKSRGMK